jgi:hypothetical protein
MTPILAPFYPDRAKKNGLTVKFHFCSRAFLLPSGLSRLYVTIPRGVFRRWPQAGEGITSERALGNSKQILIC